MTSFQEFQGSFGGLEDLVHAGLPAVNQLAHAVRLFFAKRGPEGNPWVAGDARAERV